jgi:hypothetical protein
MIRQNQDACAGQIHANPNRISNKTVKLDRRADTDFALCLTCEKSARFVKLRAPIKTDAKITWAPDPRRPYDNP